MKERSKIQKGEREREKQQKEEREKKVTSLLTEIERLSPGRKKKNQVCFDYSQGFNPIEGKITKKFLPKNSSAFHYIEFFVLTISSG